LRIPPLRERRQDIPLLATYFLERLSRDSGLNRILSDDALKLMLAYDWPGNVRELENCIERAVALGDQRVIDVGDLPPALRSLSPPEEGIEARANSLAGATDLEDIERVTIQRVFEQVNGDKTLAGQLLGISRATLYRKLKRYGIGLRASEAAAGAAAGQGNNGY
jgi:DNA-binding NtrC family response regulator